MPRLPSRRKLTPLPNYLNKKLLAYASAASTVGVGLLALVQSAEASIVFTPAHQTITPHGELTLDLNSDGIIDFFVNNSYSSRSGNFAFLRVSPVASNRVVGFTSESIKFVSALAARYTVGSGANFVLGLADMEQCQSSTNVKGPWIGAKNRFVGFKLVINNETHFGWARFSVKSGASCQLTALLTGYAYETVPGKSIVTGQRTGTTLSAASHVDVSPADAKPALGLLAQGAPALAIWRREEERAL